MTNKVRPAQTTSQAEVSMINPSAEQDKIDDFLWAFEQPDISNTDRLVLLTLCLWLFDGSFNHSMDFLAEISGVSRPSVARAIKHLEALGLISRKPGEPNKRGRAVNLYTIITHQPGVSMIPINPSFTHGLDAYMNHGCRCDISRPATITTHLIARTTQAITNSAL